MSNVPAPPHDASADEIHDGATAVHSPTNPPSPDGVQMPGGVPRRQRAAVIFIFLTVSLDMLALGMIAPVLPHLVESFVGGSTEKTAEVIGLFGTVFAIMQFFFSRFSDHFPTASGAGPLCFSRTSALASTMC